MSDPINTGDSLAPLPVSRIQNSGTNIARRPTLDFTGSGVTVADDPTHDRIVCTISGGSSGVTSVGGTAPIVSSGGNTPAISITAADGSNAGSLTAASQTIGGIKTFSLQPISVNGYKLSAATLTEDGSGNLTINVVGNNAAGPMIVFIGGTQLNLGSSYLRIERPNTVIDYNFKFGGQLEMNGSCLIGDSTTAVFSTQGNHPVTIQGTIADSATAIGVVSDTQVAYTTAGAEIHEFKNHAVRKAAIGKNGQYMAPTGNADSVAGTATLSGGTVTVSTTAVTAASMIFVSRNTVGGTVGHLSAPVASITAATSFVINSSSGTDTSTINWFIVN